MKALYITANPKLTKDSVSLSFGELAVKEFKNMNPNVPVTTFDLAANEYQHVNAEMLKDYMNLEGVCGKAALEFISYDYFIIAAPMWNLTIPSVLKAYLDNVIIPNITFQYNQNGRAEGLCNGSMLYLGARGGDY